MVECVRGTSGGKGNLGRFIERDGNICAAGIPSAQAKETVAEAFQQYKLVDEVDALVGDAIIPPPPPRPLPPLGHPVQPDQRNAGPGISALAQLVNPPPKTKFQCLVADLKDTSYKSYWKNLLAKCPDPIPKFPEGYDIEGTNYGRKYPKEGSVFDLIYPKDPPKDQSPPKKQPGIQTRRNYCQPPFNPDLTYGRRSKVDKRGIYMKCSLTDDRVAAGNAGRMQVNYIQADYKAERYPVPGKPAAPYNNIIEVPEGHAFGKVSPKMDMPQCLTTCTINPELAFYHKCLGHLNALRKLMSSRFPIKFSRTMYLNFKYYDKENTGWLPKKIIYDYCASKLIRFDPELIEPLLAKVHAFCEDQIDYKMFCHILDFKQPLPSFPKVPGLPPECLDYRTTYREMTKPDQEVDNRLLAGVASGRYLDREYPVVTCVEQCRAHNILLPQETEVRACLNPSILTLLHVSHRDMYAKREPHVIRRVFEAAGEEFTDERFDEVWKIAQKHHSQGWVCYETFRRALDELAEQIKKPVFQLDG